MDEIRCAVEFREDDTRQSPGRLSGVLMVYGSPATNRAELFAPGALSWPANGIIVRRQHARDRPIMRVIPEVRGSQVVLDAPLPDTQAGRDTAAEIRDGLFAGLSIEFRATAQRFVNGRRIITKALLNGAGLVDSPEYPGSRVELRQLSCGRRRLWL